MAMMAKEIDSYGVGGDALVNDQSVGGNTRSMNLLRRAVKERWPITEETMRDAADQAHNLIKTAQDERVKVAAIRAVVAMEAQNQKDDHRAFDQEEGKAEQNVNVKQVTDDIDPEKFAEALIALGVSPDRLPPMARLPVKQIESKVVK